jgi:hypothetical protein
MLESGKERSSAKLFRSDTVNQIKNESLDRYLRHGVRMPRLATVRLQVEKCQQIHGPEKSNALFQCIRNVVRSVEPKQ